ncbi:condensin complex subunit 3-like [Dermacentor variabilis]|uniref:condensin complex subunit 3-like n=1 Tax=Dermacentor variabilis TaxID=34621 RepID=UPI003F5CACF2
MDVTSMTTLCDVLTVCQDRPNAFERGLEVARKVYGDTPFDEFLKELVLCLQFIIPNTDSGEYVECLLDFTARFVASPTASQEADNTSMKNELLEPILRNVLEWSGSGKKIIRERCCLFVEKLLGYVTDDSVIDDKLFEEIESAMLTRLRDRIGSVRSRAVGALSRLQDPSDSKCKIVKHFLFHIEADPSADVRVAVVSHMVPSSRTLGALVERSRDTREAVRKRAYERIAEKVPVRYLKIKQRTELLDSGLNDPSNGVRQVVVANLIPAWLKHCQDSVADLIKLLDVHGSEKVVEALLKALLKTHGIEMFIKDIKQRLLDQDKLIPEDKLSCEGTLYWRILVQTLRAQGSAESESRLDEIFPDLTVYCGFVSKYVLSFSTEWEALRQLDHQFVSQQLILLLKSADLADTAGRERLLETVRRLLLSTKVGSLQIPHLMKLIRYIHPEPYDTLQEVEALLPEIQAPLAATQTFQTQEAPQKEPALDMLIAKIKVQLNILREDLSTCIEEQNFDAAKETKKKITELEGELSSHQSKLAELSAEPKEIECEKSEAIILKCLILIAEMMAVTPLTSLTPFLQTCLEDIILPGIVRMDMAIRKQAVRALSYCCVLNKDVAMRNLKLLFEVALVDQPQIQSVALAGALDVLLTYGLETFDSMLRSVFEGEDDDESPIPCKISSGLLVDFLTKCTDMEEENIRAVAAEGMAKLQLYGHICSPTLMSALILHWINPDADKNSRFHQVLGAFMRTYSLGGPKNTQCFEEAFMPTLDAILTARSQDPLTHLDPADVLNFLVEVTLLRSPENPFEYASDDEITELTPHDRLAELLCREVLKDPDSPDSLVFVKALTLLRLTHRCAISDLMSAVHKMEKRVTAKRTIALVKRFKEKLLALSPAVTLSETDEMSSMSVVIESTTSNESTMLSATKKKRALTRRTIHQGSVLSSPPKTESPVLQISQELFSSSISS